MHTLEPVTDINEAKSTEETEGMEQTEGDETEMPTLIHFLNASISSEFGSHESAIMFLLTAMKGDRVINGGRPQWMPTERSKAKLRLLKTQKEEDEHDDEEQDDEQIDETTNRGDTAKQYQKVIKCLMIARGSKLLRIIDCTNDCYSDKRARNLGNFLWHYDTLSEDDYEMIKNVYLSKCDDKPFDDFDCHYESASHLLKLFYEGMNARLNWPILHSRTHRHRHLDDDSLEMVKITMIAAECSQGTFARAVNGDVVLFKLLKIK